MKNTIKIAHLASFKGNIGDNASHAGFYNWFEHANKEFKIKWNHIEIRDLYRIRGLRKWDDDFISFLNTFDAIVIGGGGYFELWVEDSPSGCSIEFSPEQIEKIQKPIFFNSIGIDIYQGSKNLNIKRFEEFLESICQKEKNLISLRNDGSKSYLKNLYKNKFENKIFFSPDNGFFSKYKNYQNQEFSSKDKEKILLINIASDMPKKRFSEIKGIDKIDLFCKEIANAILVLKDLIPIKVIFSPHIYSDIDICSKIIYCLPDYFIRSKVSMAPYLSGFSGSKKIFSEYYGSADIVWGNRFHSNICSIALNNQTIGLFNYVQIMNLYKELDQVNRLVNIKQLDFSEQLITKSISMLDSKWNLKESPEEAMKLVKKQLSKFLPKAKNWLENI